jgi:N-ethylmaleimide reductase
MNGTRYTDQLGEAPPPAPRAMTLDDIKQVVADFGKAARNAVDAGFDGIELHCSTGYLMEQFLNPSSNHRTDAYGGSIQNRARFVVELLMSVSDSIGPDRVGIRVSPYSFINDLVGEYPGMEDTYRHLVAEMNRIGILYQHLKDATPVQGHHPAKRQLQQGTRRGNSGSEGGRCDRFRAPVHRQPGFGRTARKRLADRPSQ